MLVLLGACALFAKAFIVDYWRYDASDLEPIVVGGMLLDRGQADHLYDHDKAFFNRLDSEPHVTAASELGIRSDPRPYVMPPAIAVVARPLTGVSYVVLGRALLLANLLAALGAILLLDRHFRLRLATPLGGAAVLVFLHQLEPMRAAAELGQTTPLVLLAIVGAFVLDARDRQVGAGLALAFATALKLTPALLVVPLLVARRWRAVAAFAAATGAMLAVGLIGVGATATGTWIERMAELSMQSFPAFNNQSLGGFLLRFERPMQEIFSWKLFTLAPAYRIASLAVLASGVAACVWIQRRVRHEVRRDLIWSVCIVLVLAVPSISWNHYYLYILLPAACVIRHRGPLLLVAAGLAMMWRQFGLGSNLFIHGNLLVSGCFLGLVLIAAALAAVTFASRDPITTSSRETAPAARSS
ncbi:MAG TPA: glycosyltransferase family 87 protein [Kofleriaceae bacterium]